MNIKSELLESVIASFSELVTYVNQFAKAHDLKSLPKMEWTRHYWKKNDKGGLSTVNETYSEPRIEQFLFDYREELGSSPEWKQMMQSCRDFKSKYAPKDESFKFESPGYTLLHCYYSIVEAFTYDQEKIDRTVSLYKEVVTDPNFEMILEYELRDFKASKAFDLAPDIEIKPIDLDFISAYWQTSAGTSVGSEDYISEESWLCKATLTVPKGNYTVFNDFRPNFFRTFSTSLFMMGDTGTQIRMLRVMEKNKLISHHLMSSPNWQKIGSGSATLSTEHEIERFIDTYAKLSDLDNNKKYMLPISRISFAMERYKPADTYIDLTIALEALLASDNEKVEATYRFALRGSFILDKEEFGDAFQRMKLMKQIYNTRSRIVHGSIDDQNIYAELEKITTVCRAILTWYLEKLKDDPHDIRRLIDKSMVDADIQNNHTPET